MVRNNSVRHCTSVVFQRETRLSSTCLRQSLNNLSPYITLLIDVMLRYGGYIGSVNCLRYVAYMLRTDLKPGPI